MPKTCGICSSSHAEEVNQALVSGLGVRVVAAKFGFSKTRVHEHKRRCIAHAVQAAVGDQRAERGKELLQYMKGLQKATFEVLSAAMKSGDASGVLAAVREARQNVSVMGQLLGQIGGSSRAPTVNNAIVIKVVYEDSQRDGARGAM